MSRIYFHSPSGDREIYGRERAWMGCLTDDLGRGVLVGRSGVSASRLRPFVPPGEWPHRSGDFADAIWGWCRESGAEWEVRGERYNAWEVLLNTCLAVGDDAVKLCARLHAQCEIHCYAEGPNRAWLAGLIRRGVRTGVIRDSGYGPPADYGKGQWSDLAAWLESTDAEPVVCSYSVCEQFPNRSIAGWQDDSGGDGWHALAPEAQWDMAMARLREDGPELTPDGWDDYRFGHRKDAFWLIEQAAEKQEPPR